MTTRQPPSGENQPPLPMRKLSQDHHSSYQSIRQLIQEQLKAYRRQAGLTQKQLAIHLQVSAQQYQKYESGHNRMSAEQYLYLFGQPDTPHPTHIKAVESSVVEKKGHLAALLADIKVKADVELLHALAKRLTQQPPRRRMRRSKNKN